MADVILEAILVMCLALLAFVFWIRKHGNESEIGYTPRGDRVVVRRSERPAPAEGEMLMPSSQQRPLDEGTVIAVGPEIKDIEVGEHICFLEFAGTAIEVDGQPYLSMRSEEIHGRRC